MREVKIRIVMIDFLTSKHTSLVENETITKEIIRTMVKGDVLLNVIETMLPDIRKSKSKFSAVFREVYDETRSTQNV